VIFTVTGHRANQAHECPALPCATYRDTAAACRTSTQQAYTQRRQQSAKGRTDDDATALPASVVQLPAISREESPW
jgi:hypothetical protein